MSTLLYLLLLLQLQLGILSRRKHYANNNHQTKRWCVFDLFSYRSLCSTQRLFCVLDNINLFFLTPSCYSHLYLYSSSKQPWKAVYSDHSSGYSQLSLFCWVVALPFSSIMTHYYLQLWDFSRQCGWPSLYHFPWGMQALHAKYRWIK